ncbi:MAG: DUF2059 domain-containing protein [Novosphingobium sp.]|nr:DUF2059 domain-containing protein [Novosphingobium sp.]MBO9602941.1 DUF2059 domain-containing protein [Novosphingobium sp.]
MKTIWMPLAGAVLVLAAPAAATAQETAGGANPAVANADAPLDPASVALAHRIVDLAFPPEKRKAMFAGVMDALVNQMRGAMAAANPDGDKELATIVDHSVQRMFEQMQPIINAHLPDYFDAMANAYARAFSPDELQQLLAFASTQTGQHFFERSTTLLKDPDVIAANQRMTGELLKDMPQLTAEMKADVAAYVEKKMKRSEADQRGARNKT